MKSHEEKALAWMDQNPQAYRLFDRFAVEMAKTNQRFGAKLIAERIRWECRLNKVEDFKVNNNYVTTLAKVWAMMNPDYQHLIKFRDSA